MKLSLFFLLPLVLSAQHISYSSGAAPQDLSAVVYRVTACNPPGAPAINLPQGVLMQPLQRAGAQPLLYAESIAVFNEAPSKSPANVIIEGLSFAAIGTGALMQFDVIAAKKPIKDGVTIAGGVTAALVPLIRQKIPPVSPLLNDLIGPWLTVPAGSCGIGVMLGSEQVKDFEVTL